VDATVAPYRWQLLVARHQDVALAQDDGPGSARSCVTGDIGALADTQSEFAGIPVLTKPFTVTDFDRVLGDVEVGV